MNLSFVFSYVFWALHLCSYAYVKIISITHVVFQDTIKIVLDFIIYVCIGTRPFITTTTIFSTKKQLVESMADVRPSEYLGFNSLESIILAQALVIGKLLLVEVRLRTCTQDVVSFYFISLIYVYKIADIVLYLSCYFCKPQTFVLEVNLKKKNLNIDHLFIK